MTEEVPRQMAGPTACLEGEIRLDAFVDPPTSKAASCSTSADRLALCTGDLGGKATQSMFSPIEPLWEAFGADFSYKLYCAQWEQAIDDGLQSEESAEGDPRSEL